ncbi:hypothetical protein Cni_G19550 [Canna indica]|uniref:Uncharacterized protein n=1 Tax=Canna indica TaxID=4628 RepID=A0AAQ3QFD2_9LILI|nr:hypothetical protein Cni_G19550 [Canna indica]
MTTKCWQKPICLLVKLIRKPSMPSSYRFNIIDTINNTIFAPNTKASGNQKLIQFLHSIILQIPILKPIFASGKKQYIETKQYTETNFVTYSGFNILFDQRYLFCVYNSTLTLNE